MSSNNRSFSGVIILLLIFLCGLSFYAYEFFLRLLPGAYPDELMQHFHINQFEYSFLISSYNFTYLAMQIPAGLLLDYFGNRRVIVVAILLCGLGNIIFINADYSISVIGRLLVGFGSAFAFVAVLKLSREYLPGKYFTTFASIAIALGTLGGAFSQQIANYIFVSEHWQSVFISSGLISLPLIGFVWCVLWSSRKFAIKHVRSSPEINDIKKQTYYLLKNKRLWVNGFMGALLYAPTVILTAQWGVYVFIHAYGLSRNTALEGVTLILLGWVVFSPVISMLSDVTKAVSWWIYGAMLLLLICVICIFFMPISSVSSLMILLFLFGAFSSAQVLVWNNFNQFCPQAYSGTGIALTNMLITLLVELIQLLSGFLLNLSKDQSTAQLTMIAYVIIGCVLIGVVFQKIFSKFNKNSWKASI